MGTNYYVLTPSCKRACEHCTERERVHLGKSSVGWKFLFQADSVWSRGDALSEWLNLAESGPIEDEYGRPITLTYLLGFVMRKQGEQYSHGTYYEGVSGDRVIWDRLSSHYFECKGFDFSDSDFS